MTDATIARHVLVVEPDGTAKIAAHDDPMSHERVQQCLAVEHAWQAFNDGTPLLTGRFFCDVGEDGNFEIGSRLP